MRFGKGRRKKRYPAIRRPDRLDKTIKPMLHWLLVVDPRSLMVVVIRCRAG